MTMLATLANSELLRALRQLVAKGRVVEADILTHLGEVDARRLYLAESCPSMFRFCTDVLHFSEATAFHRIRAARVGRAYPDRAGAGPPRRDPPGWNHAARTSSHSGESNAAAGLGEAQEQTGDRGAFGRSGSEARGQSACAETTGDEDSSISGLAGSTRADGFRSPHEDPRARAAGGETVQDPVHGKPGAVREAPRRAGAAAASDSERRACGGLRSGTHSAAGRCTAKEVRGDLEAATAVCDARQEERRDATHSG